MGLETGTYVGDLNTANPLSNDPKSQGDDHLRLIKTVLKNTFAGFSGVVVATGSEAQGGTVNDYVVTVSPAPAAYTANTFVVFKATHTNNGAATLKINALTAQTLKDVEGNALSSADIANGAVVVAWYDGTSFFLISGNDRADRSGETYTGTHDFTGATLNASALTATTQSQGDNSNKAATTAYVDTGLAPKANLASPALTGTPTAPTAAAGTNNTQIATTAFAVQLAFQAVLPAQGGNGGKFLKTDGSTASWQYAGVNGYAAKTSSYTLLAADKEVLIDCTSGTFTLAFTAAATLGNTWAAYVRNSGTGDITLDPNGSETIDGLTSYLMYPGEARLIFCDGTSFRSIILSPFFKTFTASGTFTKPPGYSDFGGLAWSGGNSGGKSGASSNAAAGGGGGGCFPFNLLASALAASETVTIGAGGAAQTGTGAGASGGSTSFGSWFTVFSSGTPAGGGAIGFNAAVTTSVASVGFEGVAAIGSGLSSIYGGSNASVDSSSASGNSIYGGAAGGGVTATNTLRSAGTSKMAGSGGSANTSTSGVDGTAPGGGGGATQTGTQSGAGARGELRIWGVS
jgi:hypothetical protein